MLLVACVNVASLLLARSAAREREFGMRTAFGARRARLVRQMLTESLVLAVLGGLGGIVVATLCHRGLLALVGDRIPIPRIEQLRLDLPVVLFTMAIVALGTGLLFGIVPAFVTTSHANEALRDGGRHGGGRRLHHVLRTLVVAEVAISLVLLTGAGLLLRSFIKLQNVDPGFRADGVLTASVDLPSTGYDLSHAKRLLNGVITRVAALPGVVSTAGSSCQPVPYSCIGTSFWRVDRVRPPEGQLPGSQVRPVTPHFFKTMGIPQIAAATSPKPTPQAPCPWRSSARSSPGTSSVARIQSAIVCVSISSTSAAETMWSGRLSASSATSDRRSMDLFVRRSSCRVRSVRALASRSLRGPPMIRSLLSKSVTDVVRRVEPRAPVEIRTLDTIVGNTIARPRALSILLAVFALVGLALAAVGVYGVMAYSVRERTQEIGVRMALGATQQSVARLIVGQALRLVLVGVAIGLAAAMLLTRSLVSLLYDIEPLDPWTFAGTALLLLVIATVAAYVPARRGMRMAPVEALRVN